MRGDDRDVRDDSHDSHDSHDSVVRRLDAVVNAYDVRGAVPDPLSPDVVAALARGFAELMRAETGAEAVVVGHDMRTHSPTLVEAVTAGVTAGGSDAILIGLAATDQLYFASGQLDRPGVMVTASHNPAGHNGLKLCRAGAGPVGRGSGLEAVRDRAYRLLTGTSTGSGAAADVPRTGQVSRVNVLDEYAQRLRELAPAPAAGRRLRVVVDAGNAMAGHTAPAVLGPLDVDLLGLAFELDGTFPLHDPNPLDPATLTELSARVRAERADLGLAFDGDADRCFVVAENGELVNPSTVTALVAVRLLADEPGATVVHNLICSRAVAEVVTEHGGRPVRTPVGHSLIKAEMARTGAVFGGEHSGHYYFREFWRADSGMLAALHVLAALAADTRPLSELVAPYARYAASGEISRRVPDPEAVLAMVRDRWSNRPGLETDQLDGLTVRHPKWWFNLRASNTEPLLRLNAEAVDEATMQAVRDEVLAALD